MRYSPIEILMGAMVLVVAIGFLILGMQSINNNQKDGYNISLIFGSTSGLKNGDDVKISGINGIALTKLDVLDELDEIKMCVEYELNGKKINYLPAASEDQFNIKPIYKTFPGWKSKTQGIKNLKDLPDKALRYIHALEDFIGARISSISTSPEREDTILVEDPFNI